MLSMFYAIAETMIIRVVQVCAGIGATSFAGFEIHEVVPYQTNDTTRKVCLRAAVDSALVIQLVIELLNCRSYGGVVLRCHTLRSHCGAFRTRECIC